jgi:hypothetical protein
MKIMTETNVHYDYLDLLRDSGITNMVLAAPFLAEEFALDPQESRKILLSWMKSLTP